MPDKITRKDILLYFANGLDRKRRREIEAAYATDDQVRRWFDDLRPTEEEIRQLPQPVVSLDAPEYRALAVQAFLGVQRDEWVARWRQWLKEKAATGQATLSALFEGLQDRVLETARGFLLYRNQILDLGGDPHRDDKAPPGVPCVYPSPGTDSLIIRQGVDEVPSGIVTIIVVRRRHGGGAEELPALRVEMERMQPPEGDPYWYADVALSSLVKDFHDGDDLVYCVEAVSAGSTEKGA